MKKILIVLILASVFVACDDDEKPTNWTRYEYLNEARDYIYFKTGTWWVYKKIPGGELDTIEVFEDWVDTLELTGLGNTMHYEDVSWHAKSRLNGYTYRFFQVFPPPNLEYGLVSTEDVVWKRYFMSKSRPGSFLGQTNLFTYPFTSDVLYNGHEHETKMSKDIDTITVQKYTYHDVKHFNISNDATFIWDNLGRSGGIVEYYFAPSVGIIKIDHKQKPVSWELVDSYIVQ